MDLQSKYQLAELAVKSDGISRVVYELNGKYYTEFKSNYTGIALKTFDYETISIPEINIIPTESKGKSNKSKAVPELRSTSDKKVLSNNGDSGSKIPITDKETD